jgi:hypothetical protein
MINVNKKVNKKRTGTIRDARRPMASCSLGASLLLLSQFTNVYHFRCWAWGLKKGRKIEIAQKIRTSK